MPFWLPRSPARAAGFPARGTGLRAGARRRFRTSAAARSRPMSRKLVQAGIAFLALPGMVAFALPLWVVRGDASAHAFAPLGVLPMGLGVFLLLWCVRYFYVSGKGTLAPWTPPQELVVVGLYCWSRNPVYLSVGLVLLGWTLGFGSRWLLGYTLAVMIAFHLRVVIAEEPFLARKHGEAWQRYRAEVRRWL